MTKLEIVRRIKTYSAENGYVYQYQFHDARTAEHEGRRGAEYIYYVTVDRKTMFAARVLVMQDAIAKWSAENGRAITGTEEYAVAKMRLFEAFDETEKMRAGQPAFIVDATNIERLLEKLNL